jgi:hypothetical protein
VRGENGNTVVVTLAVCSSTGVIHGCFVRLLNTHSCIVVTDNRSVGL